MKKLILFSLFAVSVGQVNASAHDSGESNSVQAKRSYMVPARADGPFADRPLSETLLKTSKFPIPHGTILPAPSSSPERSS